MSQEQNVNKRRKVCLSNRGFMPDVAPVPQEEVFQRSQVFWQRTRLVCLNAGNYQEAGPTG